MTPGRVLSIVSCPTLPLSTRFKTVTKMSVRVVDHETTLDQQGLNPEKQTSKKVPMDL